MGSRIWCIKMDKSLYYPILINQVRTRKQESPNRTPSSTRTCSPRGAIITSIIPFVIILLFSHEGTKIQPRQPQRRRLVDVIPASPDASGTQRCRANVGRRILIASAVGNRFEDGRGPHRLYQHPGSGSTNASPIDGGRSRLERHDTPDTGGDMALLRGSRGVGKA